MEAQIDYDGFFYRTDRVHEFVSDLLEGLRSHHPEIADVDVRIKRSFFGTYSTKVAGRLFDERIETSEDSADPVDGFETCLGRFRRHVENAKSRRLFASAAPLRA